MSCPTCSANCRCRNAGPSGLCCTCPLGALTREEEREIHERKRDKERAELLVAMRDA